MVRSSHVLAVFCLLGLLVVPAAAAEPSTPAPLSTGPLMGTPVISGFDSALNAETMKAALRTATVEEEGFIERALQKSQSGQLPAGMLESTFQWARRKPANQFQYFKRALILRAQQAGVDLEKPDPPAQAAAKPSFWANLFRWWKT